MSQQLDIENDPFLLLLSDALRAGPGSPQWHEAVAALKNSDESVDEYKLLIEAREALESGREYRSVRPGAGFTRKVMSNIEQQEVAPDSGRRIPTATLIALLAAVVILVVAAILSYELYPRGAASPNDKGIIDLASTFFANDVVASTFDAGIPMAWRTIGSMNLEASGGLRAGQAHVEKGSYIGGGVATVDSLPASQPLAVQVSLHVGEPGSALIPQVFVSNSSDFSSDRGVAPQELVWQLEGTRQQVVVGGDIKADRSLPRASSLTVRLLLNHDLAIVELNGKRLWAGPNGLGDGARYVGVRFIRAGEGKPAEVVVQSVRIQKS